jgi:hypothetical protein
MKPVGIESLPESVLTGAPDLPTGLLSSPSTPYDTPLAFMKYTDQTSKRNNSIAKSGE